MFVPMPVLWGNVSVKSYHASAFTFTLTPKELTMFPHLISPLSLVSLAVPVMKTKGFFFNASVVHHMGPPAPTPIEAWCVDGGGKITAIGPYDATRATCPEASATNMKGAVILPGLIDSHLHLMYGGMKLVRPQLDNCSSPQAVVDLLEAWVKMHPVPPGSWLQGFGWGRTRIEPRGSPVLSCPALHQQEPGAALTIPTPPCARAAVIDLSPR